jgi:hypothetical protein
MDTVRFFDNRGVGKVKIIFWLLVLFAISYSCYKLVPTFFHYQMMKYEVENEAEVAHLYKDTEIRDHILKRAREWYIPLKPYNLHVVRRTTTIDIEVYYEVTMNFFDRYEKTFKFDIKAREPLKHRR